MEARDKDLKWAMSQIEKIPTSVDVPRFSEWAEQNRYFPPGVSTLHGRFNPETAPHLLEPLDKLHPDDPCRIVTIMKSVQSGVTTSVAENALGCWIDYKLGSMLSLTSSREIAKVRASANVDVMIDHSGLADKIKPHSNRSKRKVQDSANVKEFEGGGKWLNSSYNSIASLKSNSFNLIIKDELDEAPAEAKDQGDINEVIAGRTMGQRMFKIVNISTPSRMETSQIYRQYLQGDQRKFFVPCPHCMEPQEMVMKSQKIDHGLTFTTRKGPDGKKVLIPETVRYICKGCHEPIYESKKEWMLNNGEWIATATPLDPKHHSYHISALMSPESFLSWERICQQFINTGFGEDLLKFKDFTINFLGKPWASTQKAQSWEELKEKAGDYALGEVPGGLIDGQVYRGPLALTGGVDVQKDRLELHVVGWGVGMESWSVDYKIFYGNTANIDDPCWVALANHVYETGYVIAGKESLIYQVAVDSGYNPGQDWGGKTHVVHDFIYQYSDKFFAIMGLDETKQVGILQEKRLSEATITKRYNVASGVLKEIIFSDLDRMAGPRAIHVPSKMVNESGRMVQIPDDWYKQFCSERWQETKPGEYGWKLIYKRNEVLDTFIYAMATAYKLNFPALSSLDWWNVYETIISS